MKRSYRIVFYVESGSSLYPIEIKKNSAVKSDMAAAFPVLDKAIEKRRGPGTIICTSDYKLKLRENLLALPIEYI